MIKAKMLSNYFREWSDSAKSYSPYENSWAHWNKGAPLIITLAKITIAALISYYLVFVRYPDFIIKVMRFWTWTTKKLAIGGWNEYFIWFGCFLIIFALIHSSLGYIWLKILIQIPKLLYERPAWTLEKAMGYDDTKGNWLWRRYLSLQDYTTFYRYPTIAHPYLYMEWNSSRSDRVEYDVAKQFLDYRTHGVFWFWDRFIMTPINYRRYNKPSLDILPYHQVFGGEPDYYYDYDEYLERNYNAVDDYKAEYWKLGSLNEKIDKETIVIRSPSGIDRFYLCGYHILTINHPCHFIILHYNDPSKERYKFGRFTFTLA